MRTLAVTNHKGGVGKTTVTYHLAGALRDEGFGRGLVIDADDQANLTRALLPLEDCSNVETTTRDVLTRDDQALPIGEGLHGFGQVFVQLFFFEAPRKVDVFVRCRHLGRGERIAVGIFFQHPVQGHSHPS